jgi:hypothetical protein
MAITKIALKGVPIIDESLKASEAIKPGHLVDFASATTVQKSTHNGTAVARRFALDRPELGNEVTTAYDINDRVKIGAFHVGSQVAAFISSGDSVAPGTMLESSGNGKLETLSSGIACAMSLETKVATADTLIAVEIV